MVMQSSATQPIELPPLTSHIPSIGGVIRQCPEDFEVEEIPAYHPDLCPDRHLLFVLKKRELTSDDAVTMIAQHCQIPTNEFGIAGLKDKYAITKQWVSAPASAAAKLASFSHPKIEIGPQFAHSHKLRRGHLRGNRFVITIRNPAPPIEQSIAYATLKLNEICTNGLSNHFGPQRFGKDGLNGQRGLSALQKGLKNNRSRLSTFILSAGQSLLFNAYVQQRRSMDLWDKVLLGDVLKKTDTGGIFICEDPKTDQERLRTKKIVITGPIYGNKMKRPLVDSPAEELEQKILNDFEITHEMLLHFGRKLTGTRRELIVRPESCDICEGSNSTSTQPGVRVSVILPSGSFATNLLSEVMGPLARNVLR